MKGFIITAWITMAALGVAWAAPDGDFAIPVIGHVFDAGTRAVRPMTGTPGAATVGAGLVVGEFERALVPPDGSIVLASSSEGLRLLRASTSGVEAIGIENASEPFDKGVLSPSGTSALLYSAACNCIRVISDLRGTPKLSRTISLPEAAEVRALAMSDTSSVLAVAAEKLLLYTGDSGTVTSEVGLVPDAISFDAAGERLLVVDKTARTIHMVTSLGESPVVAQLLTERDGLSSPSAAAFADNAFILVADADAGILLWNEADRTVRSVECACKPSAMEPTATRGLYRLSGLHHGAVWILDSSAETPRTFFVPASRIAEESK
jgi:hypothetical protein